MKHLIKFNESVDIHVEIKDIFQEFVDMGFSFNFLWSFSKSNIIF